MYNLNENEEKIISTEMVVMGQSICETHFFETQEYRNLVNEMLMNFPKYDDYDLIYKNCTKAKLLEAGKYVIDKHTYGTDTRIRYVNMDELESELLCLFGESPKEEKFEEIIDYIDNNVNLIKVTEAPLELNLHTDINGRVETTYFYPIDNISSNFYAMLKPTVRKIVVEGCCDDYSKCTYVHEMYHALLKSHKGAIENHLDDEVVSIFMERVAASDLDESKELVRLRELTRLLNLKNSIIRREYCSFNSESEFEMITHDKYILSTAIATALFDTYNKGTKAIKKEIDDSINGIIREEHTLEDVLQQFDATPESGSSIMRRHIKKLSK